MILTHTHTHTHLKLCSVKLKSNYNQLIYTTYHNSYIMHEIKMTCAVEHMVTEKRKAESDMRILSHQVHNLSLCSITHNNNYSDSHLDKKTQSDLRINQRGSLHTKSQQTTKQKKQQSSSRDSLESCGSGPALFVAGHRSGD